MKNENIIAVAKDISNDLRADYKLESGEGTKIDFNVFGEFKLTRGGIIQTIEANVNVAVGEGCILSIDNVDVYHHEEPKKEGIEDIDKFVAHLKEIGLIGAGLSTTPSDSTLVSLIEELACLKVLETVPFVKGYRIKDVVKLREDL